jgi:diguanylate cyclase (GGDEF)-like protein
LSAITLIPTGAIVDRWRSREKQLELLSRTDPLTGLANRRRFMDVAERLMALARRHARPIAVVIVDLDHFKAINDRLGHVAGDVVLTAAAGVLRDTVRQEDVAARWGGEEFALLLPDTDAAAAAQLAQACLDATERLAMPHAQSLAGPLVSISLGCATLVAMPETSPEQLLQQADAALYQAKRAGRRRWHPGAD